MKLLSFSMVRVSLTCLALIISLSSLPAFGTPDMAQEQDKAKAPEAPKVSDGEAKAAKKINEAGDPTAKMKAGAEFIKKYPKSPLRPQVMGHIATQIDTVSDPAQKITLSESFLTQFTDPSDGEIITPTLINAYLTAERFDDAFRLGATWLAKKPDDLPLLSLLAQHAIIQARSGNTKFAEAGQQYAVKAITLIESETKPATIDDAQWTNFKKVQLPHLYQALGFAALVNKDPQAALSKFEAAALLNQNDPVNYWIIGNLKNDEYRVLAQKYQNLSVPSAREQMLPIVNAKMDEVIDLYARVVALSAGKAPLQTIHDTAKKDLETYYKFRHKDSTDGLQQLIDKYKATATTP